ncbi:hypothetical protein [Bradyrhizobium sp. SSUT77]|uniref:hypothetical protein n=1 Tax=Bradyrhizobium sp. SSUT77 TaxID=3040603 RepID=UPI0024488EF3|nr:hypothetical protein [Bradyrhizobium sp. SSUT77]MDH2348662.1 hypothetical protein [Bradyrhizobium sp. SSUT77]
MQKMTLLAALTRLRTNNLKGLSTTLTIDPERAELIAARAVAVRALTYKSIASIIANKLERSSRDTEDAIIEHPNLRGPGYFH